MDVSWSLHVSHKKLESSELTIIYFNFIFQSGCFRYQVASKWGNSLLAANQLYQASIGKISCQPISKIWSSNQPWVGKSTNPMLVGGFNPCEKYARQIGPFPQVGMKKNNLWNHHLAWVLESKEPVFLFRGSVTCFFNYPGMLHHYHLVIPWDPSPWKKTIKLGYNL